MYIFTNTVSCRKLSCRQELDSLKDWKASQSCFLSSSYDIVMIFSRQFCINYSQFWLRERTKLIWFNLFKVIFLNSSSSCYQMKCENCRICFTPDTHIKHTIRNKLIKWMISSLKQELLVLWKCFKSHFSFAVARFYCFLA